MGGDLFIMMIGQESDLNLDLNLNVQGVFLHWVSPKKLKYGKPRLGESTLIDRPRYN